jgi:signal transduction histidine kinase
MKRSPSIKLQLTLWYASIMSVMLLVFVVLFSLWSFFQQINAERTADVETLREELADTPDWFNHDLQDVTYPHRYLKRFALYRLTPNGHDEMPMVSTDFWSVEGLDWAIDQYSIWQNGTQFYTIYTAKQWIEKNNKRKQYLIAVAVNITTNVDSLKQLLINLLLTLPIVFLLSLFGGYWLVERSLSPLRKITKKVEHINAEQLVTHLVDSDRHDEIGQLAQALNHSLDRIDQSFQRLKNFTADASHQLRTPLTIIRHVGELSLSTSLTVAQYRDNMGSLLEEANKLEQMVDSLLLLTRLDSKEIRHVPAQCDDIAPLITDVIDTLQVLADEKQQTIHFMPQEKISVYSDPSLLIQALMNILHNAILYTPIASTIRIRCFYQQNKPYSIIEIADNGAGIASPHTDKIFDRFYRVNGQNKQIGTGLGLAVAQQMMRLTGGDIILVNPDQQGAIFHIHCYLL